MTTSRRFWAASGVLLALVGLAVNVWRPLAPRLVDGEVALASFDPSVMRAVLAYREPRLVAAVVSLLVAAALPVVLVWWPRSRAGLWRVAQVRLARSPAGLRDPARGGLVAVAMLVVVRVATFAPSFFTGYLQERDWGFRTAGVGAWLRDWAIGLGVEVVVAFVAGALFVALVRRWPGDWHHRMVIAATGLSALLVLLQPLLVQPLLLRTQPLPDGDLRTRLTQVVAASGIDAELVVGDASRRTTKINAFVTGLGPSRQVVLWDTLLERPVEEVVAVVAHELAHRDHRDLPRGVLLTATGVLPFALVLRRLLAGRRTATLLGRSYIGDPRSVAVLVAAIAVAQTLALPPALWASRRAEAAADHRALVLTRNPSALVTTFRGFVVRDLSWPDPPAVVTLMFSTHPSVSQRIRAVVAEAERAGMDLVQPHQLRDLELAQQHARIE